jgi:hypothetical protein
MTEGIPKRFCVRCGRVVNLDADIGAVELDCGQGVMCGVDVDKLIAEIHVGRETWERKGGSGPGRKKDYWL